MSHKRQGSKRKPFAGLGVFVVVIGLVWYASFSLFGNVGKKGGSVNIPGMSGEVQGDTEGPVLFADWKQYPIVMMFDNSPEAREHHAGLSEALVVYEALVEGGATRLMAVFAGAPSVERVGPIRSVRPYFVETAAGWSGYYWHAGGSPEGLALIPKTDVVDLNEISGLGVRYFWRDNAIARPHNLFSSGELMAQGIEDFELYTLPEEKLIWEWMEAKDADDLDMPDEAVRNVYVDYSEGVLFDASYTYDDEKEAYVRSESGYEHVDQNTGEPLIAHNIIIQRVPSEGYYPSGYGRISLDMLGEGEMVVIQKGHRIQGTWHKSDTNTQTEWLDEDGDPVALLPGTTWVEIVPGDRSVLFE